MGKYFIPTLRIVATKSALQKLRLGIPLLLREVIHDMAKPFARVMAEGIFTALEPKQALRFGYCTRCKVTVNPISLADS
jgi:hypothetical protein